VPVALASTAGALEALAPELSLPDAPFVIAKFAGSVSPEARRALRAAGYREVSHLPYDAMLLERPRDAKAVSVAGLVALAAYLPEDRLARDLLPNAIALRTSRNDVPVMIHVMPGHERDGVRAVAIARGGTIAGEGEAGVFGRVTAIFPVDQVAEGARALADLPEVFVVERIHHVGWLNDRTAGTIQSGVQGHDMAQTPIWAHGIRGEGQIVAMADTGLDANSCYFNGDALPVTNTWSMAEGYGTKVDNSHRKIVAYDFLYSCDQWPDQANCEDPADHTKWDTYGHGTHVAGNMVGDSDMNPENFAAQDGMAPAAKIVVQDASFASNACSDGPGFGCPVMKLDPLFEQARLQGASVHNNSWGDNEDVAGPLQCNYTARSQDVDRYIWEHKDFLIIYAAGNYGAGNIDFSVGSPSTNKNGLSIGSTRTSPTSASDENISSYSSRGWTSDGRIKPDLMVPGNNTAATNDNTVDGTVNWRRHVVRIAGRGRRCRPRSPVLHRRLLSVGRQERQRAHTVGGFDQSDHDQLRRLDEGQRQCFDVDQPHTVERARVGPRAARSSAAFYGIDAQTVRRRSSGRHGGRCHDTDHLHDQRRRPIRAAQGHPGVDRFSGHA
jgi:subtilisin family serine protease